jgi:hypothetical protein
LDGRRIARARVVGRKIRFEDSIQRSFVHRQYAFYGSGRIGLDALELCLYLLRRNGVDPYDRRRWLVEH